MQALRLRANVTVRNALLSTLDRAGSGDPKDACWQGEGVCYWRHPAVLPARMESNFPCCLKHPTVSHSCDFIQKMVVSSLGICHFWRPGTSFIVASAPLPGCCHWRHCLRHGCGCHPDHHMMDGAVLSF